MEEYEEELKATVQSGTRYKDREWKRDFYHIAKSAGIPVVMAVIDCVGKVVEVEQTFNPTEDMEADIKAIQGFYVDAVGINPTLTSKLE